MATKKLFSWAKYNCFLVLYRLVSGASAIAGNSTFFKKQKLVLGTILITMISVQTGCTQSQHSCYDIAAPVKDSVINVSGHKPSGGENNKDSLLNAGNLKDSTNTKINGNTNCTKPDPTNEIKKCYKKAVINRCYKPAVTSPSENEKPSNGK